MTEENKNIVYIKPPTSYDLVKSVPSSPSSESDTTESISHVSSINSFLSEEDEIIDEVNTNQNYSEDEHIVDPIEEVDAEKTDEEIADEVDPVAEFHGNILEYFQSQGLQSSSNMFIEECKNKGIPILTLNNTTNTDSNSSLYEIYKHYAEVKDPSIGETNLQTIQRVKERKNMYKQLFFESKARYNKLIGGTLRIVEALRCKESGIDYDMQELQKYLEETLPDIFTDQDPFESMEVLADGKGDYIGRGFISVNKSEPEEFDDVFSSESDNDFEGSFVSSEPSGIDTRKTGTANLPNTDLSKPCPKPPGTYNISPENSILHSYSSEKIEPNNKSTIGKE